MKLKHIHRIHRDLKEKNVTLHRFSHSFATAHHRPQQLTDPAQPTGTGTAKVTKLHNKEMLGLTLTDAVTVDVSL